MLFTSLEKLITINGVRTLTVDIHLTRRAIVPDQADTSRFPALPARSEAPERTSQTQRNPWQQAAAPQKPETEADSVIISVSDVLDYFEKCPSCGYHAQATATTRRFDNGRLETTVHPTCGLPCGWHGTVQVTSRSGVRAEIRPAAAATDPAAKRQAPARPGKSEPGIRRHPLRRPGLAATRPLPAIS